MRTSIFVLLLFLSLLASGVALAQEQSSLPDIPSEETVTLQDLDAGDPKLLPNSPLYFLKEWGRTVRSVFTLNSVAKAELELRFTNEKAAEVKKIQETQGGNENAIKQALGNYEKAQIRLKARFEALRETSENPNVDKLLDKLADRVVKHEKLFDEIAASMQDKGEVQSAVQKAKEKVEETAGKALEKDDPAKFVSRLEKALVESKGSELKHLRSLEVIERLSEKAPEKAVDALERLKEGFAVQAQENLKEALKEKSAEEVRELVEKLPGDKGRRSIILEELKVKAQESSNTGLAQALEKVAEKLEKVAKEEKNIAEKAKEQINRAKELIQKLKQSIAQTSSVPSSAQSLAKQAEEHLKKAREALEQQKFGEAYGQARSAEVASRNALRILEEREKPEAEDLKEELAELEAKIERHFELLRGRTLGAERIFSKEAETKLRELLAQAREHLGFAKDAFSQNNTEQTQTHIAHVKGFLKDFVSAFEAERKNTDTQTGSKERLVCTEEYNPVCGADDTTYSNACKARVAGVNIVAKGECNAERKTSE